MEDPTKTVTARDGCVVESESLARVLVPFIDAWRARHPQTGGQAAGFEDGEMLRNELTCLTGAEWLSQETGIPEGVITGLIARDRATGDPKPRTTLTELRVADALVAAIGHPEVFCDGTLDVRPNPRAKSRAQAQCCAGSTPRGSGEPG